MKHAFCEFCKSIYGGSYNIQSSILTIKVGKDQFRLNLADKLRFGRYILFHKNNNTPYRVSTYHKQCESTYLAKIIYGAWTHDFCKENKIKYNPEDFEAFMKDFHKSGIIVI